MARSIKIVFYAVNGGGVGHLTRMIAIARWARRYASFAGYRPEIVFLTSSEADGVLFHERFASFKVPSKTAAFEGGLDKATYLALAKQWVWHSVGLLRPDLFVVDTFPRGSFSELGACLDLCKKKAFVYRPVKADFAERAEFQSVLPFYDLVISPESRDKLVVPPAVLPRVREVGPITVRDPVELDSRETARRRLALPADAFVVFVSAGGGGDPGAERDLHAIVDALSGDPSIHVVVAAGPLYRGAPRFGERIRFVTGLGVAELARAADVAVSSAGYNGFHELMLAGVPTVFIPQEKIADEQDARAERARAAGAARVVARPVDRAALLLAVAELRDPAIRAAASAAALSLVPASGARLAAREILKLAMPASEVDAAALGFTDEILASAKSLGLPESVFVEAGAALDPGPDDLPPIDARAATDAAVRLVRGATELGIPAETALRVCELLLRKLDGDDAATRADACLVLLRALAPFDDWPGAAALLRMVSPDTFASAGDVARDLALLLEELRRDAEDLYRGIQRVVKRGKLGAPRVAADRTDEPTEDAP